MKGSAWLEESLFLVKKTCQKPFERLNLDGYFSHWGLRALGFLSNTPQLKGIWAWHLIPEGFGWIVLTDMPLQHYTNIWTVIGWHARVEVPSCLKRGDQRICYFHRCICLHEKICTRMLERRTPLSVEPQIQQEQCERMWWKAHTAGLHVTNCKLLLQTGAGLQWSEFSRSPDETGC